MCENGYVWFLHTATRVLEFSPTKALKFILKKLAGELKRPLD
jgi:hypothetical protein